MLYVTHPTPYPLLESTSGNFLVLCSPADGELFSVVQSPKGHPPHCERSQTEDTHLIANDPST
ncbi:hypothetical protein RhiirC2_859237 [Rhizophagus irregularis]|uniref:Uncharacterized protein n=1 Tax=Rhizophagus irregularis TaxID=588596 RepID=A0A2N1L692_9GLOM|nr:hypothetical protein RhiirC2_859237 [Rhizophagus irregularis]